MERFEVFNAQGQPLHKNYVRGTKTNPGEYMPVIHVWIRDASGRYLIQQRAKHTDPIPYQWATTTGLPELGETFLAAARRETYEELGLWLPFQSFKKIKTVTTHEGRYRTITQVYLVELATENFCIKANLAEVLQVDFVDLATIKIWIQERKFWNYPTLLQDKDYFSRWDGEPL